MRRLARFAPAGLVVALLVGAMLTSPGPRTAIGETASAAGIGERLRYIGRDNQTSMPVTVNDRFIAEVEKGFEDYGKVIEHDPVPAPPLPPGTPTVARLAIPAIGVDAPVGRYGVDAYGRLDVPQDARTVGWNPAYADLPGTGGATFFAAHFEYGGTPGVFNRLSNLVAGDVVTVTLSDGAEERYRVTSTIDYGLSSIDMGALLHGREGIESITLMTCSGPPNEGNYPLRTVVLAERLG